MIRMCNLTYSRAAVVAVWHHRARVVAFGWLRLRWIDGLLQPIVEWKGIQGRLLRDVRPSMTGVVFHLGEKILPHVCAGERWQVYRAACRVFHQLRCYQVVGPEHHLVIYKLRSCILPVVKE